MVLARLLAAVLLVPPPSSNAAPEKTLGVLPLLVEGQLPGSLREDAAARVLDGARRSPFAIVEIEGAKQRCETPACFAALAKEHGADYLLDGQLTVSDGQRRYAFEGRIIDADGNELFSTRGGCEVCGFEEAATRIEDAAAAAAKMVDRPSAGVAGIEVRGTPVGATLSIDGDPVGELPLTQDVPPGRHRLEVSMPGFISETIDVDAQAGTTKVIDIELRPAPPAIDPKEVRRNRAMVISGAVLVGVGVGAVVTGGVFAGLQGRPYRGDCMADVAGNCRRLWNTGNLGIGLLVGGAVSLVTGAVLLAIGKRRQARSKRAAYLPRPMRASTNAIRWSALRSPSFFAVR